MLVRLREAGQTQCDSCRGATRQRRSRVAAPFRKSGAAKGWPNGLADFGLPRTTFINQMGTLQPWRLKKPSIWGRRTASCRMNLKSRYSWHVGKHSRRTRFPVAARSRFLAMDEQLICKPALVIVGRPKTGICFGKLLLQSSRRVCFPQRAGKPPATRFPDENAGIIGPSRPHNHRQDTEPSSETGSTASKTLFRLAGSGGEYSGRENCLFLRTDAGKSRSSRYAA